MNWIEKEKKIDGDTLRKLRKDSTYLWNKPLTFLLPAKKNFLSCSLTWWRIRRSLGTYHINQHLLAIECRLLRLSRPWCDNVAPRHRGRWWGYYNVIMAGGTIVTLRNVVTNRTSVWLVSAALAMNDFNCVWEAAIFIQILLHLPGYIPHSKLASLWIFSPLYLGHFAFKANG